MSWGCSPSLPQPQFRVPAGLLRTGHLEKFRRKRQTTFDETDTLTTINTMATNSIKLLTGNSYPQLAQLVADRYVLPSPNDTRRSLARKSCVDLAAPVLDGLLNV